MLPDVMDGTLSAKQKAAFDLHIATCAECSQMLADAVRGGRIRKLELERIDGEPVLGGPAEALLIELGFRSGPRRLTLSA